MKWQCVKIQVCLPPMHSPHAQWELNFGTSQEDDATMMLICCYSHSNLPPTEKDVNPFFPLPLLHAPVISFKLMSHPLGASSWPPLSSQPSQGTRWSLWHMDHVSWMTSQECGGIAQNGEEA